MFRRSVEACAVEAGIAQCAMRCRRLERPKANMTIQARNKSKPGALQKRLDAQKRKTDNENLLDAAKGNVEFRTIDETAARLRHD